MIGKYADLEFFGHRFDLSQREIVKTLFFSNHGVMNFLCASGRSKLVFDWWYSSLMIAFGPPKTQERLVQA